MDKIYYLCDRKACDSCNNADCKHTHNIKHASNFIKTETNEDGCVYFEKEIVGVNQRYSEFFNIEIKGQQITCKLKKKYQRAFNKLIKQVKRVGKAMLKLKNVLEIDMTLKDRFVEVEVKDVKNT